MADLAMDLDTNDLAITNASLTLVHADRETAQRLKARLRMFRGEWFLNVTTGVPGYQTVFIKGQSLDAIAAAYQREILSVPGVVELQFYNQTLDRRTRRLTIDFRVLSTDGEIIINEVVQG